MKAVLVISVAANLMLVAWVGALASRREGTQPPAAGASSSLPAGIPSRSAAQLPVSAFEWRQLESSDYRVYVANLRGIKCPEQTIRDIITADVAALFARKRSERGSEAGEGNGIWSNARETNLLEVLLGRPGAIGEAATSFPAAEPTVSRPARVPLIFRTEAIASLRLSAEQREEIVELERQFTAEVGGTNQDYRDPVYLERWRKAQAKADELIVSAIGRRALVDLDQAVPADDSGDE